MKPIVLRLCSVGYANSNILVLTHLTVSHKDRPPRDVTIKSNHLHPPPSLTGAASEFVARLFKVVVSGPIDFVRNAGGILDELNVPSEAVVPLD